MSLGNALGVFFTKQNKQAGSAIFARDGVTLRAIADGGGVAATVRDLDGSVHSTVIRPTTNAQSLSCSCPEMRGHRSFGYCKHLWATAIAADDHRVSNSAAVANTTRHALRASGLAPVDAESRRKPRIQAVDAPRAPAWRQFIERIESPPTHSTPRTFAPDVVGLPYYVLDIPQSRGRGRAVIKTFVRQPRRNGTLGKFKPLAINSATVHRVEASVDKVLVGFFAGWQDQDSGRYSGYYNNYYGSGRTEWAVDPRMLRGILPALQQSGRFCYIANQNDEPLPITVEHGPGWELVLCLTPIERDYTLRLEFRNQDQCKNAAAFTCLIPGSPGVCLIDGKLSELHTLGFEVELLREFTARGLFVPRAQADALVRDLMQMQRAPRLELPESWALTHVVDLAPAGQLELTLDERDVNAEVSYRYGDIVVPSMRVSRTLIDPVGRRQIFRQEDSERVLQARLTELGFKNEQYGPGLCLPIKKMPDVVRELSAEGWTVLADGQLFRKAGEVEIDVTSGIDWFDVEAAVDFGGVKVRLPALLKALRSGQKYIKLADGTLGMLPEEWLNKHASLLDLAQVEDNDKLRFANTQVLLLDALLAEQRTVRVDELFSQTRERLRTFDGVRAAKPTAAFHGTLRPYQEQGLGWMGFLDQFNWGGCLADDMGLGKTVQVLAFLASRKEIRRANGSAAANVNATANALVAAQPAPAKPMTAADALGRVLRGDSVMEVAAQAAANGKHTRNGNGHAGTNGNGNGHVNGSSFDTSLVVVPKSLVHNWIAEARRFTPGLNVIVYHGSERHEHLPKLGEQDLIVTTYHTLRNDIIEFSKREFDYVILDEAQSIKNAKAQIAKAVRLLKSRRRLALSGTPVENQLADLWSLFEFLNPGMLGAMPAFKGAFAAGRESTQESMKMLRGALRPFMLRRTKEQVAKDLPEKTEETLWCEMTTTQQKRYDELKTYYRAMLLGRVKEVGLAKSKIQVLEALLRLRQASCHPRLLDEKIEAADSGKCEALLPMLKEIMDGGHKALVFSQFTSFLAIIRKLLDDDNIAYEYLDGQTRDRQERVQRFQTDPDCKLFLISLKAGGLGLNLTAADYVFILDPWWNPAVEAQAIDRSHRIGQTKKVIAYRMIAKGTVEEKIIELQNRKRDLAASIITEANSLIADLTREDLEALLS